MIPLRLGDRDLEAGGELGGEMVLLPRPQRLTADRLGLSSPAIPSAGAEEALDFDLHERAVGRLREMTAGIVDERQAITVLAKLYIAWCWPSGAAPWGRCRRCRLMLTYVRQINGAIPEADRKPRELVVRALQHLAQASEENLCRPRAVRRIWACALCQRRTRGHGGGGGQLPAVGWSCCGIWWSGCGGIPDGAALRLVLDPLADYLAALGWLRQLAREHDSDWEVFLEQTLPARGSEGRP